MKDLILRKAELHTNCELLPTGFSLDHQHLTARDHVLIVDLISLVSSIIPGIK